MATYYVAASGGDNGNDGSSGSPWATLAYAVTAVSSGDTIYMQAGTHTINTVVNIPIGVNLTGAGETSIITSTSLTSEWSEILNFESASIANGNQSISYLYFDGGDLTAAQAISIAKRHNVKIHHCTFIDFHYTAIYWNGDGGSIGSDPYTSATPPTNYVTGSEFHDNTVTNCAHNQDWDWGRGALMIGGHDGMLLYNNSIIQDSRPDGYNGYVIKTLSGWMKGWKVYNNTLKTALNQWLFAIEGFFFMGCEFYGNTIQGSIDVNFSWRGDSNEYDYGVWIHDNTIGPLSDYAELDYYEGIVLEFRVEDAIIERNYFRNIAVGIHHTMRDPYPWVYREKIRYNIFYNLGYGNYHSGIRFGETSYDFDIDDLEIYNNVFHSESGALFGIHMRGFETATNIKVINNIFQGIGYEWFTSNRGSYFDNLYIQNNIAYSSGSLNLGGTPTNYTNSDNLTSNPLFVDAVNGDFTLQSGSPAIDAGLDLGLTTDYRNYKVPYNSIPDIGAYEYGSSPINTYYVAASGGDNTDDGSIDNPWATLSYAVTKVSEGDIIYMLAGTHTITSQISIPVGVSITGSGVTSVISSTVSTAWQTTLLLKSATGTNGNQTISNLKFDGNSTTARSAIDVYGRSNVIIHDCSFYDFFTNAIMFDGSENYQQSPPSTYATGNKAYNDTIINCSDYPLDDNGSGAILMGGQDGLEIYDCYIDQTQRALRRNGYNIKFTSWGFNKGFKIYNNTLIRSEDASTGDLGGVYWAFSIELWHTQGGAEIYNNTMTGGIDVGGGGTYICLIPGSYDYGIKIYGNTIGGTSIVDASVGIFLECNTDGAIIEKNTFKNLYDGIRVTPGTRGEQVDTAENHRISYNIFNGIGYYGIRFINGTTGAYVDSVEIVNNVFYSASDINSLIGVGLLTVGTTTNLNVSNNIIMGFDFAPMFANGAAGQTLDNIQIQNNIMYGNGNNNVILLDNITPTNYTNSGNLTSNPLFTTPGTDFTLQSGSPAIDAGLDLGLTTDYRNYVVPANSIPDIGAYEYNSIPSGDATPVTSITVSGAGGASTISTDGGTLQLSASVLPEDATNKNVTWSISSGTGSATISSGGLVTAVSDGTVTARATAADGSGVYDDYEITISNQAGEPEIGSYIFITKVEIL